MLYYRFFQLPKLHFSYVVKQEQGFAKMYFSFAVFMYQGTKIAFQNALFLGFFESSKPSNFQGLLIQSKNALEGDIFTSLCCNCDTKSRFKSSF